MFLFPQLMFKPHTRVIVFDESGIQTRIGKKTGNVPWRDIENIEDDSETICIRGKNLNAFLVPRRAFQSQEHRTRVLRTIREWARVEEPR